MFTILILKYVSILTIYFFFVCYITQVVNDMNIQFKYKVVHFKNFTKQPYIFFYYCKQHFTQNSWRIFTSLKIKSYLQNKLEVQVGLGHLLTGGAAKLQEGSLLLQEVCTESSRGDWCKSRHLQHGSCSLYCVENIDVGSYMCQVESMCCVYSLSVSDTRRSLEGVYISMG